MRLRLTTSRIEGHNQPDGATERVIMRIHITTAIGNFKDKAVARGVWWRYAACLSAHVFLTSCAMFDANTPRWEDFAGSPPSTSTINLNHQQTGHGDPVLLIHGFGESAYTWRHVVPHLARRYRVIAIDLKGFGDSPKPRDGAYHIYENARAVLKFITDHDLRNITLVGHSLGGGVALVAALYLETQSPNRLSRLILIDSIAYRQTLPLFIRVLATPGVGPLLVRLLPERTQVKSILKLAYHDDDAIPDDAIDTYARLLASPGAKEAALQTARQIIPADVEDLSRKYADVSSPTLILWGREDRIVPLWVAERLNAAVPDSRLEVLDDVGHVPHEEDPSRTLEVIDAFLREPR